MTLNPLMYFISRPGGILCRNYKRYEIGEDTSQTTLDKIWTMTTSQCEDPLHIVIEDSSKESWDEFTGTPQHAKCSFTYTKNSIIYYENVSILHSQLQEFVEKMEYDFAHMKRLKDTLEKLRLGRLKDCYDWDVIIAHPDYLIPELEVNHCFGLYDNRNGRRY